MNYNNFIHLRTQSSYSLSDSALKIDKLIELTKEYNMPAVALTDINNMFGTLEFSIKCFKNGIQPIIGTTINLITPDTQYQYNNIPKQITLICMNKIGYKNLLLLSSKSHIQNEDNLPSLNLNDIYNNKEGLMAYLGGIYNPILHLFNSNKITDCKDLIISLKNEFKENLFFELQRIQNETLDNFENKFINLALENDIPLIATNNVQFPNKDYFEAHDSLICIAEKVKLIQEHRKKSNPNTYFKSSEEMCSIFKDIPEVIQNTFSLALKCSYAPKENKPKLPKFKTINNQTESEALNEEANIGLNNRLIQQGKKDKVDIYTQRLKYELEVINKMGFAGYFLIVSDFIQWAKKMIYQ